MRLFPPNTDDVLHIEYHGYEICVVTSPECAWVVAFQDSDGVAVRVPNPTYRTGSESDEMFAELLGKVCTSDCVIYREVTP